MIGIDASVLSQSQALESLLIQQGVVAIAKPDLTAEQIGLLRETGVIVLTNVSDAIDTDVSATSLDEVVDQVVERVRL